MVFVSVIRISKQIFELITSIYGCLVPRKVRVEAANPILGHDHDDITTSPIRQLPKASTTSRVSSYVKGGLGLMVTATLDLNIAFVTSYWVTWKSRETDEHGGYGMWKTWECRQVDILLIPICTNRWIDASFPVWLLTTKVLLLLGVLGQTAALIMLLIYAFFPSGFRNKALMAATIGTNFSAGLLVVVGLCVFGFKVIEGIQDSPESDWFLSYSFSLACTAFVLSAISGSILMTESKRLSQRLTLTQDRTFMDIHLSSHKLKS